MYKTYNELIQEGVVSNSSELGKFLREGVIQKVNGSIATKNENLEIFNQWISNNETFQRKDKRGYVSFLKDNGFLVDGQLVDNTFTMLPFPERFIEMTPELKSLKKWNLIDIVPTSFYTFEETFDSSNTSSQVPSFFTDKKYYRSLYHEYTTKIRKFMRSKGLTEVFVKEAKISQFDLFDSLLIPQNHPARTMQDLFFMEKSKENQNGIPVENVKKIHTANPPFGLGTQYVENDEAALRSHLTPYSLQNLGKNEGGIFIIAPVFRREKEDKSHLAEFTQIEVSSVGKGVKGLINFVQEFFDYLGMGMKYVESYFPYTCPSLEFYAMDEKGNEYELAGGGVFREELSGLYGFGEDAMAMGFGLERLIMICENLDDISEIYERY